MFSPKYGKLISGIVCIVIPILLGATDAIAHKVTLFAWVEGDMVHTESKFSGGKKAKNAPVEVYDAQGNKLLQGQTDDDGNFSFRIPQKTEMKVVLVAGMGHRGEWTIPADEVKGEGSESNPPEKSPEPVSTEPVSQPDLQTNAAPGLSAGDIQKIVENALDRKLEPVLTKLNESMNPDRPPKLSDILGGIGYIIGLVGIGAYINYRKKRPPSSL